MLNLGALPLWRALQVAETEFARNKTSYVAPPAAAAAPPAAPAAPCAAAVPAAAAATGPTGAGCAGPDDAVAFARPAADPLVPPSLGIHEMTREELVEYFVVTE